MNEDDRMRAAAHAVITHAEERVDVERDLDEILQRLDSATRDHDRHGWRPAAILAVAASALLVVGTGALLVARDDVGGRVATAPDPTTEPTAVAVVEPTPPPKTSPDTLVDDTVSVVDETAPPSDTTPVIDPTVPSTAQFESVPPVDGTVVVSPDSNLQLATFSEYAHVPFDVDPIDREQPLVVRSTHERHVLGGQCRHR